MWERKATDVVRSFKNLESDAIHCNLDPIIAAEKLKSHTCCDLEVKDELIFKS